MNNNIIIYLKSTKNSKINKINKINSKTHTHTHIYIYILYTYIHTYIYYIYIYIYIYIAATTIFYLILLFYFFFTMHHNTMHTMNIAMLVINMLSMDIYIMIIARKYVPETSFDNKRKYYFIFPLDFNLSYNFFL